MPVYTGDAGVLVERTADVAKGDPFTLTRITMSAHTGTHVDAPAHFISGGRTVDELPLESLIGPATLVDMTTVARKITPEDLQGVGLQERVERILLKTRNSELWREPVFQEGYVSLSAEGAQWLVDRGVRLVAIDYLSVEAFGVSEFTAHSILLSAGVVILEGVDLGSVGRGKYDLICLPLRVQGAEGAPARSILIQEA